MIKFIGLVAQWITRLTTDQEIPGSTPGRLDLIGLELFFFVAKYIITTIYRNNKNISFEPDLNQWPMDNSCNSTYVFVSTVHRSTNWAIEG